MGILWACSAEGRRVGYSARIDFGHYHIFFLMLKQMPGNVLGSVFKRSSDRIRKKSQSKLISIRQIIRIVRHNLL